jgi:hypothetical protein
MPKFTGEGNLSGRILKVNILQKFEEPSAEGVPFHSQMNHSQLKFYHIFTPGKDLEKPPLEIWVSLSPHTQPSFSKCSHYQSILSLLSTLRIHLVYLEGTFHQGIKLL